MQLSEEMIHRFQYHPPSGQDVIDAHQQVRTASALYAGLILTLVPPGREQSLAITKIEEAMFWANGGIARAPSNSPEGMGS
jgi:hypothetical protein